MVKNYRISGTFQMGTEWMPFVKEKTADSESTVTEWIYSELGSKHRTPRTKVKIDKIEEIAGE